MLSHVSMTISLAVVLAAASVAVQAQAVGGVQHRTGAASDRVPPNLSNVGIDQKLDAQVPLDLQFRDTAGQTVTLRKYFRDRPVVLALAYYTCPMLCTEVMDGMATAFRNLTFDIGKDYQVLTVSFDPKDTPELAATKKQYFTQQVGKAGAAEGWHFLTGDEASIKALTQAVGFRYAWDAGSNQWAHATAIMVLTPHGQVSKYFYGVKYSPTGLRLGLVQASQNKIGTPVDQVVLYCSHYNAATGKYDLIVSRTLAVAGAVTILILGGLLIFLLRYGKGVGAESKAAKTGRAA
ncbi:MAG: SCO family protein [Terriglobales bacterium]